MAHSEWLCVSLIVYSNYASNYDLLWKRPNGQPHALDGHTNFVRILSVFYSFARRFGNPVRFRWMDIIGLSPDDALLSRLLRVPVWESQSESLRLVGEWSEQLEHWPVRLNFIVRFTISRERRIKQSPEPFLGIKSKVLIHNDRWFESKRNKTNNMVIITHTCTQE